MELKRADLSKMFSQKKTPRCKKIPRKRELMLSFKYLSFRSKANRGNNYFLYDKFFVLKFTSLTLFNIKPMAPSMMACFVSLTHMGIFWLGFHFVNGRTNSGPIHD
jgi:hypothetical protein